MLQEKDFILRLIRQIIDGLARAKKRAEDEEQVAEAESGGGADDLDALFEEATGLSRAFLAPETIGMLPNMLNVNPDSTRLILTAQILIEKGRICDKGVPYLAVARRLLANSARLPVEPEVQVVREDALFFLTKWDGKQMPPDPGDISGD